MSTVFCLHGASLGAPSGKFVAQEVLVRWVFLTTYAPYATLSEFSPDGCLEKPSAVYKEYESWELAVRLRAGYWIGYRCVIRERHISQLESGDIFSMTDIQQCLNLMLNME